MVSIWLAESPLALAQATQHAQLGPSVGLVVTRDGWAQDCPDTRQLTKAVRPLLRRALVTPSLSRATSLIHIEMSRTQAGYAATIRVHGRHPGLRVLQDAGPDCGSLAQALAISLAILIDGQAETTPASPAPASRAETYPHAEARPEDADERTGKWRLGVEAAAGAAFRLLDGPAPVAQAGLELEAHPWLSLALGGGGLWSAPIQHLPGTVKLRLLFGWVRLCALALGSRADLGLRLCTQPELGTLKGVAEGYVGATRRSLLWPALSSGLLGHGPLGDSARWLVGADAVAPLLRHSFAIQHPEGEKVVFESAALGLVCTLGVQWRP